MNSNQEYNFELVFKTLLNYWKPIFVVTLVGSLFSFVVTLFITPVFTSTVTVFPANLGAVSQLLVEEGSGGKDYMAFGEEHELEQLQQILHSDEVRDRVINEFNLQEHYKIDLNSKYPNTKIRERYDKNVRISKTRFQSIDIEVNDVDPEMAANIANRISDLVDTVYKKIQTNRTNEALVIVEREYNLARQYILQIEDSLATIRAKGINNYKAESEVYNAAYAEALAKGNVSGAKALQEKIELLSKYGGASLSLIGELELEQKRVSVLKDRLLAAQVNAQQIIPRKYVVNKAYASERKSYPVIWVIVTISGFCFALISSFFVIIYSGIEKKNDITVN